MEPPCDEELVWVCVILWHLVVWSWLGAIDVTALITISAAGLKIGKVQAGHLLYCRAAAFPAFFFLTYPQSCECIVIPVKC